MPRELRQQALDALSIRDADSKVGAVARLAEDWANGRLLINSHIALSPSVALPGQPAKPTLVSPLDVKRRSMNTIEGRAALIHALAHIEFNAINLALDAIWRFADMPEAYYTDWLQVAKEEAYHFDLLAQHLTTMGYSYGDFVAHNSLWDMAEKTTDDILARIALVPRTMEARGLDASPPIRAKLAQVGDMKAAEILDIILRDEIGHVAIGNRWFYWLCEQRSLEPMNTFRELCVRYSAPKLRGPFNLPARLAAGFSAEEMQRLSTEAL